ncbi:efflux RND transporter permease subunit [bacterium]|nr:efflux RND transporter permease subunit [bacterium]
MKLAKFSVNNSVLVNMIMIIVFILGISAVIQIPKEEMPPVDFGAFVIIVIYPGVSPAEIEELVIQPIEEEISDISDIDYVMSSSLEGRGVIQVRFEPNTDIDQAWNDLNTELDKVTGLPEDAEDPVILRLNMREVNPMCDIVIGGDFSGNAIREIAESMKEGLLNVPYVSKVDVFGTREREIWIQADVRKLDEYGLTLDDLINVIKMRNMNVPGGTVQFGKVEFIVRTMGEFENLEEVAQLIVRMDQNGRSIQLEDVADVADTLAEQAVITKLDGEISVGLFAYKKEDGNIVEVMKDIREYVDSFKKQFPGLEAAVRNDGSIEVRNSLNTLGRSALFGVILVFLTLWLFLGWRKAFFAAWGIPFSFLMTFAIMNFFGITLNTMTLFGLVLVLGMIVDDAIIVLENVHRYMEKGLCPSDAAIKGSSEISWPIVAAVSTTVAAFLPMLLMEGMMGKFMMVFPIVVSIALFASLFEALVILPSHIADLSPAKKDRSKSRKILAFLVSPYMKVLKLALRHRFITIMIVTVAMLLSLATVGLRLVKFEFFPKQAPKTILLKLKTPMGTHLDRTNEVVTSVENHILSMEESEDIEAIVSSVGMIIENYQWNIMSSYAQLSIDLVEVDKMTYTHDQIKDAIRSYLDKLPSLYSYQFDEFNEGPPTGKDVEIRVKGDNLERLEYIGDIVRAELQKIPGVVDIQHSFQPGKKEVQIVPKHEKLKLYGLTVAQVAGLVRTASYGATVSQFRGTGTEEYDMIIRLKEDQVEDFTDLENLKIRTFTGDLIRLKDIADFEITGGLAQIDHRDKKRIVTITANTAFYQEGRKRVKRTSDEVKQILLGSSISGSKGTLRNFEKRYPGYQLEFGGVVEEQMKSYRSLYKAFLIALLLVFGILATQFKSYVQPFIVMVTIPFAFIGVIFGLLVTGLPFSLNTLIAVVALAGVVVNDSLVLVDFVNRERARGVDRWNSLINAGSIRLRPILLTTITTIVGLLPMIFSQGKAAASWKPMAVSIAFGLAFATMITLLVIPVIYSLVDSFFGKLKLTRFKEHKSFDEAMECRSEIE